MNSLITITETEGKKAVSARELYLGLGLDKSQWARWNKANIQDNEFFLMGQHWQLLDSARHDVEDNKKYIDFIISIEFAKHIAMMARTEKSHEYRNYFLECEKQLFIPQVKLSKELQAIFALDEKTQNIDKRLDKLENTMTIDYSQQENISTKVALRVINIVGGTDAPAYKELSKKAFKELYRVLKRVFQVNSYRNIAVVNYEKAIDVICDWEPTRELQLMIIGANSQIRL